MCAVVYILDPFLSLVFKTCAHVHPHTNLHPNTHPYIHTYMHAYIHAYIHIYKHTYTYIHSYMHTPFLVGCQLTLNIILAPEEICERPTLRCLFDCIVTCWICLVCAQILSRVLWWNSEHQCRDYCMYVGCSSSYLNQTHIYVSSFSTNCRSVNR